MFTSLKKPREIGAHCLSGAVLDPRALRELIPDFEQQGAPVESPVTGDSVYFFTKSGQWKLPIDPPFLRNHGNYLISINKLVKWMGEQAERRGPEPVCGVRWQRGSLRGVARDRRSYGR